ncbi:4Fe-4S dicluster domain-containing protein [Bacteroides sp.]|uniref:ATP-binding protein n=1 Tax=Bacteroides sp. TaxID=29523 RepID=UPI002639BE7C|nr:4Fe-4S dicluster domain-containing protein [Bacteroides sp.]MDD3038693.1 4Fe-4S binding protein [Bacteroides sp.]
MENNEKNPAEDPEMESDFFVSLMIDYNKCNNCGRCTEVCVPGVLVMVNNQLEVTDVELCNKCADCLKRCLKRAISIND